MPGLTVSVPGVARDRMVGLRPLSTAREPGARTVLLLHGMANNGNIWKDLVRHCADHRDLALWSAELPWRDEGVGDWAHDPDPAAHVVAAIDMARERTGRVDVIVAHSFSAALLLRVLADRPEPDLAAAVFIAPFHRPAPTDFDWGLIAGLVESFHRTMQEGIRVVAKGRGNPELHGLMAQRVCERIGPYGWTRFLDTYLNSPWVAIDRIGTPSLVVSGEDDSIAPPSDGRALAGGLPSARFTPLSDCGHFPMVERSQDFAEHVLAFLGNLPHPASAAVGPHQSGSADSRPGSPQ